MRLVILILLLVTCASPSFSQTIFNYRYTEVCSGKINTVKVVLNNNSDFFTVFFFGETKTFSKLDYSNGLYDVWMGDLYTKWTKYYPCAEIKELITDAAKSASESGDVDVSQPIVIMASDFGYKNRGVYTTTAGYNKANLLTSTSEGILLAVGTDVIGNIGYFRISPFKGKIKSLININLLLLQQSFIGNITFGLLGDAGKIGSYFVLHTMTFGKLNGYPFQDNTMMLGHSKKILDINQLTLSTNLILSYTYRVKVFTLDYWMEDYIGIKPFINMGYKLSPTFGLNVTYTTSLRTDRNTSDRYSILLGGRVLF
jgi:hypothetical protein